MSIITALELLPCVNIKSQASKAYKQIVDLKKVNYGIFVMLKKSRALEKVICNMYGIDGFKCVYIAIALHQSSTRHKTSDTSHIIVKRM